MKKNIPFYSGSDQEDGMFSKLEEFIQKHENGSKNDNIELDPSNMNILVNLERDGQNMQLEIPFYEIKPEAEYDKGRVPGSDDYVENYIGIDNKLKTEDIVVSYKDVGSNKEQRWTLSEADDLKKGEQVFELIDDSIKQLQNENLMKPEARVLPMVNPKDTEKLFLNGKIDTNTISMSEKDSMSFSYGKESPTKFVIESSVSEKGETIIGLGKHSSKKDNELNKDTITLIEYTNQSTSNIKDLEKEHEKLNEKPKRKIDSPSI